MDLTTNERSRVFKTDTTSVDTSKQLDRKSALAKLRLLLPNKVFSIRCMLSDDNRVSPTLPTRGLSLFVKLDVVLLFVVKMDSLIAASGDVIWAAVV